MSAPEAQSLPRIEAAKPATPKEAPRPTGPGPERGAKLGAKLPDTPGPQTHATLEEAAGRTGGDGAESSTTLNTDTTGGKASRIDGRGGDGAAVISGPDTSARVEGRGPQDDPDTAALRARGAEIDRQEQARVGAMTNEQLKEAATNGDLRAWAESIRREQGRSTGPDVAAPTPPNTDATTKADTTSRESTGRRRFFQRGGKDLSGQAPVSIMGGPDTGAPTSFGQDRGDTPSVMSSPTETSSDVMAPRPVESAAPATPDAASQANENPATEDSNATTDTRSDKSTSNARNRMPSPPPPPPRPAPAQSPQVESSAPPTPDVAGRAADVTDPRSDEARRIAGYYGGMESDKLEAAVKRGEPGAIAEMEERTRLDRIDFDQVERDYAASTATAESNKMTAEDRSRMAELGEREDSLKDDEKAELQALQKKAILTLQDRINEGKSTDATDRKAAPENPPEASGTRLYEEDFMTHKELDRMEELDARQRELWKEGKELSVEELDELADLDAKNNRDIDRILAEDKAKTRVTDIEYPLTTEDFERETQDPAKKEEEIKALKEKIASGKYDMEDVDKLEELQVDPAKRKKELEDKVLNGDKLTPQEKEDLKALNETDQGKAETPEAKVQKQIDELTDTLAAKLVNGELPTQQEADQMLKLVQEKRMLSGGLFTEEEARQAVQDAFEKRGMSDRRENVSSKVQEMLKQIAINNLQIKAIPKDIASIRNERTKLQAEASNFSIWNQDLSDSEQNKKMEVYGKLSAIQNQLNGYRHLAQRLRSENRDLEASVRSKLGVTSGFSAVAENVAASVADVMVNIYYDTIETAQDRLPGFANV